MPAKSGTWSRNLLEYRSSRYNVVSGIRVFCSLEGFDEFSSQGGEATVAKLLRDFDRASELLPLL